MYKINNKLLARTLLKNQTISNNANPQLTTLLQRSTLPISSSRYWEEVDADARVLSVAVKRPVPRTLATEVWRAVKTDTGFVVQKALSKDKLVNMVWQDVYYGGTTSPDARVILQFDGKSRTVRHIRETITTESEPYVIIADGDKPFTINKLENGELLYLDTVDTAVDISTVRGEYASGLDDGILIFFIDAEYKLYEVSLLNGVISYKRGITLLPENVQSGIWRTVRANTTFDYRIVLQLGASDGCVYTMYSKSRPGGDTINENIGIRTSTAGKNALNKFAVPICAKYTSGSDYDRVIIEFDDELIFTGEVDVSSFYIVDMYNRKYNVKRITPYMSNNKCIGVTLTLNRFFDTALPCTVICTGVNSVENNAGNAIEAFEYKVIIDNYYIGHRREYISVRSQSEGETVRIRKPVGYLRENVSVKRADSTGAIIKVSFDDKYAPTENVRITCISEGAILNIGDINV